MYRTNKDIRTRGFRVSQQDAPWTLPAGSRVTLVPRLSGLTGDGFAAADVAQLKKLSGNTHDPVYHYLTLSAADVDGESETERETVTRIRANEKV